MGSLESKYIVMVCVEIVHLYQLKIYSLYITSVLSCSSNFAFITQVLDGEEMIEEFSSQASSLQI